MPKQQANHYFIFYFLHTHTPSPPPPFSQSQKVFFTVCIIDMFTYLFIPILFDGDAHHVSECPLQTS